MYFLSPFTHKHVNIYVKYTQLTILKLHLSKGLQASMAKWSLGVRHLNPVPFITEHF